MSKSKILLLLAVFLLISPLSNLFTASAAPVVASGKCGDNLTWERTSDGVLTISGSGAMYNYDETTNPAPFGGEKTVIIGDGVTKIGEKAFFNSSCESITIGKSVSSIGYAAFAYAYYIQEVHISDMTSWLNIDFEGSDSNPMSCYYAELYLNNERVTDIVIPDGIKEIKANTFYRCSQLESITIPSSVTKIGIDAFSGCTNLKDVYITDMEAWCKIDFEGSYAASNAGLILLINSNPLKHAENLWLNEELITDLTIPDGITTVKEAAFYGYKKLESVTFYSDITDIENFAFYYCSNISDIYYEGNAEKWSAINIKTGNTPITTASINYIPQRDIATKEDLTPLIRFEAEDGHEYAVKYGDNIVSGDGITYDYAKHGAYQIFFGKYVSNSYKKPKAQGIKINYTTNSGDIVTYNFTAKTPFSSGAPFGILVFGANFRNGLTAENYIEY